MGYSRAEVSNLGVQTADCRAWDSCSSSSDWASSHWPTPYVTNSYVCWNPENQVLLSTCYTLKTCAPLVAQQAELSGSAVQSLMFDASLLRKMDTHISSHFQKGFFQKGKV